MSFQNKNSAVLIHLTYFKKLTTRQCHFGAIIGIADQIWMLESRNYCDIKNYNSTLHPVTKSICLAVLNIQLLWKARPPPNHPLLAKFVSNIRVGCFCLCELLIRCRLSCLRPVFGSYELFIRYWLSCFWPVFGRTVFCSVISAVTIFSSINSPSFY